MDCVSINILIHQLKILLTGIGVADRTLGNREGWGEFKVKTLDQGVATHVYAAFDPGLNGKVDSFNPFLTDWLRS